MQPGPLERTISRKRSRVLLPALIPACLPFWLVVTAGGLLATAEPLGAPAAFGVRVVIAATVSAVLMSCPSPMTSRDTATVPAWSTPATAPEDGVHPLPAPVVS